MLKSLIKVIIYYTYTILQVESSSNNKSANSGAGAKGSLISDISDVSQYRVVSDDINLDILPLEQEISHSEGAHEGRTLTEVISFTVKFYLL